MKIIFFFLLLLPLADALAVTPTELDITDGVTGKIYVYNTFDHDMTFHIAGVYEENFTLAAKEVKIIDIRYETWLPGPHEGKLRIEELYPSGFVNAIEIPVLYSGKISYFNEKKVSLEMASGASLALLGFFAFLFYVWKRKKKKVC